jgi:molecular chaperone DnaK (HSP70)
VERVLAESGVELEALDALLLVGGGSQLPLVRRCLKDLVGSRLKISPHPFASTAVGLAVYADSAATRPVEERFSRHFGVWREAEAGAKRVFDPIFAQNTSLPAEGQSLAVTRRYRPTHNIGHFRFEECAALNAAGDPTGHRTPWCQIYFPFDPEIPKNEPLEGRPVERRSAAPYEVEERYEVDGRGVITVTLSRSEPPLVRRYLLHGPERISVSK